MQIENNKVVTFYYSLSEEGGEQLETNRGAEPKAYLHGHRNILPALEQGLAGRGPGDIFSLTVPPEKAYGIVREASSQRVPIKHLLTKGKLKPGMIVSVNAQGGEQQATIIKVGKFNVDIDGNHPFAGKTLVFDVEIVAVRDASAEELSHRHSHGVGGHHH